MAPKFLVEPDIEFGKQLLQKLDSQDVRIDAALWVYDPESENYQLVIASRDVDIRGACPIYTTIQDVLRTLPENQRGRFSDVAVTSPSTGVVATLKTAVNTPTDAIDSIRITDRVVNRELIDDAYIYRMSSADTPGSVAHSSE